MGSNPARSTEISLFSKSFRRKKGLGARGETGGVSDSVATVKVTPTTEMLGLVMQKNVGNSCNLRCHLQRNGEDEQVSRNNFEKVQNHDRVPFFLAFLRHHEYMR